MKKEQLSIGQVAHLTGLNTSALRFYESTGLLPEPDRINGRRVYDESIFPYIAAIQLAQESGFTVAEIKQLLDSCKRTSGAGKWKDLALAKIDELDKTIARASAMKTLLSGWLQCECVSLEDCRLIAERLGSTAGSTKPA